MQFESISHHAAADITALFTHVFSDADGAKAGLQIGELTERMLNDCTSDELIGFVAKEHDTLFAAVLFSKLWISNQPNLTAVILSPMAVASSQQGKGIGQALINHALTYLKTHNVDFVVTYGDPNFYSKTRFQVVADTQLIPPFSLSYPHGWQAVALGDKPLSELTGEVRCVLPLNQACYW